MQSLLYERASMRAFSKGNECTTIAVTVRSALASPCRRPPPAHKHPLSSKHEIKCFLINFPPDITCWINRNRIKWLLFSNFKRSKWRQWHKLKHSTKSNESNYPHRYRILAHSFSVILFLQITFASSSVLWCFLCCCSLCVERLFRSEHQPNRTIHMVIAFDSDFMDIPSENLLGSNQFERIVRLHFQCDEPIFDNIIWFPCLHDNLYLQLFCKIRSASFLITSFKIVICN